MAAQIVVPVQATTISSVRNQSYLTQQNLNEANEEIGSIQSQRDSANNELVALNNQLVDLLTSIGVIEEEIKIKQKEIRIATSDLESAQEKESVQYENMKKRIKFMYEQGNTVYMQALLGATNYSDMMNKAEYVEEIYSYDRKMLDEYIENREKVEGLKATLEDEQAALKSSEYELEQEQESLEILVAIQRRTVQDFDLQLENAREKANQYKNELIQQTARIKRMEEQERKRQEKARKEKERREKEKEQNESGDGTTTIDINGDNSESDSDTDSGDGDYSDEYYDDYDDGYSDDYNYDGGGGSSLGQQICNYACQFVGNPYVYGGTSLTNGADCSGFTQSVYANFGISLPRDSASQRSCGVEVAYEDAQPGDLICYAGHVAIYLGGGQIVHASTERTGITYGYATYRTILSVRRVI